MASDQVSGLMRNLRVDDLRYFLAVADTGRLGPASERLGVDQSTVSRRLRSLEKALGTTLLTRGPGGWTLTEMGRSIASGARMIEDALERVAGVVGGEAADPVAGSFRVMAPDGFATLFVVPALVKLRKRHPHLDVEVLTATRQLALHPSGFDLAIAVGDPRTRRLFSEHVCRYRLAFYASAEYLALHGRPTSFDELAERTVVFYVDSMLQLGDLDLSRYAPGVEPRFTSTNIFAQIHAVVCGAGIGLLPKFAAARERLVEITELNVSAELDFMLAVRRESMSRPALQAVREAIHREVRTRAGELR